MAQLVKLPNGSFVAPEAVASIRRMNGDFGYFVVVTTKQGERIIVKESLDYHEAKDLEESLGTMIQNALKEDDGKDAMPE